MKESLEKAQTPSKTKQKTIEYTVKIGNNLYKRISKHMSLLKYMQKEESKQNWIQQAIKEKLASGSLSEVFPQDHSMHLKLDEEVWHNLQKKIDSLKPNRLRSISKKSFIEEAIYEKLDREEDKSKNSLKKLFDLQ